MIGLSIFILLTVCFYFWVNRLLSGSFVRVQADYQRLYGECGRLIQESTKLKEENLGLEKHLGETVALYDITKDICKTLDTNRVFTFFKEEINKYIHTGDCKFLKPHEDPSSYDGYTFIPLKIDKSLIGYLAASNIKKDDREKFHILAQQFLLGIKRAFLYAKVQELAIVDALTGAASRRYCLERLDEELVRSKKMQNDFSVLMVDIDNFKDFNDRYGHLVGDAVLKEVSRVVRENVRQIDLIGRYGGEEFLIILPETDKEQARFAGERIRRSIEGRSFRAYDEDLKITISAGIASCPGDGRDAGALIEKADAALYRAKTAGRNRVCV